MNKYILGEFIKEYKWNTQSKIIYSTYLSIEYKNKVFRLRQWINTVNKEKYIIKMIDELGNIYYNDSSNKWCYLTIEEVYEANNPKP